MFTHHKQPAAQESVWDYPRPPRVESTTQHIQVVFNSAVIADTRKAQRVLETSHPPTYYLPLGDVRMGCLVRLPRTSSCEWKGQAVYYRVSVGDRHAEHGAWSYPDPYPAYHSLKHHIAFYAGKMDACYVDGEAVQAQEGYLYGGWITKNVVGPFKGGPGTWGW